MSVYLDYNTGVARPVITISAGNYIKFYNGLIRGIEGRVQTGFGPDDIHLTAFATGRDLADGYCKDRRRTEPDGPYPTDRGNLE